MNSKAIKKFKNDIRFRDKIAHIETIPSKEAKYKKANNLSKKLEDYLNKNNIKLYEHQVDSYNAVENKENVIITTPTASGKTLAFNLPVFNKLSKDSKATALYIYPAKALSNDQLSVLKSMEKETGIKISPATYDGDTPKKLKRTIRDSSRIVLTNSYELHLILPWHHLWENFYSNLKFIIIDEAHAYRGIFGSNVAFLIRRLKRIARYYGSDPVFILSTATLANPEEFAYKLVGEDFKLIDNDSSPSAEKDFVLYNPYTGRNQISIHRETERIFLYLILNNLQTLCFTISRKMAELITMWAKNDSKNYKKDFAKKITAYRAGYLTKERRAIEKGLKNGDYMGVSCTNALELGIDIGSLDAVIISGYPGTMISTWQQAGRAGRLSNKSLVVLVAFENQLDQYFMKNPDFFFDKAHENAIIDLNNKLILEAQIQCAAHDLAIDMDELKEYFNVDEEFIQNMLKKNYLIKDNAEYNYAEDNHPGFKYSLNQLTSEIFKVMYNGKLLETLERSQFYNEAHEGAVLINKGETYIVKSADLKNKIIKVEKKNVEYHTQVIKNVEVNLIKKIFSRKIGNLTVNFGELEVKEYYLKYKRIHFSKILGFKELNLPPLIFKTKGLWFTIPEKMETKLKSLYDEKDIFVGSLHGAEHALIGLFPLHVMCDRFDIGGLSTNFHKDTQRPTIFIYDAYEGGIGITEKAAEVFKELAKSSENLVKNCECKAGCPSCIYSPKCGNDNKPLHKNGTEYVLHYLNEEMTNSTDFNETESIIPINDKSELKAVYASGIKIAKNTYQDLADDSNTLSKSLEETIEDYKKSKELFASGDKDNEALNLLNDNMKRNKNHIDSYLFKAEILSSQKKYGEASETLEIANEIDSSTEIMYKLAESYFNEEKYSYAKDILSEIICMDKEYADAYYLIGLILYNQEDYSGAKIFLSRALSLDNSHIEALELIEEIRLNVIS